MYWFVSTYDVLRVVWTDMLQHSDQVPAHMAGPRLLHAVQCAFFSPLGIQQLNC